MAAVKLAAMLAGSLLAGVALGLGLFVYVGLDVWAERTAAPFV